MNNGKISVVRLLLLLLLLKSIIPYGPWFASTSKAERL